MFAETTTTGFEDESTVIDVLDDEVHTDAGALCGEAASHGPPAAAPAPPALPFPLARRRTDDADDAWLDALPPASRKVLERARALAPGWPSALRVPGAVATPKAKGSSARA